MMLGILRCNLLGIFDKFGEYYDLTYRETMDYKKDCDILESIFKGFKMKTKSILDLGCGTGSHALILAKRGYSVAGIDASKVMIEKAKAKAEKENMKIEFHVQDMRRMKLNRKFDCAISMFGALGFVYLYKGLVDTLSGLKQHLNKGGLFIFEFWSVGGVRASPYHRWMEAKDQQVTLYRLSESSFDHLTSIMTLDMKFIIVHKDKLVESFKEKFKMRCYTLAEMRQYLESNGFKLVAAYDWDVEDREKLKNPRRETFRILAVAERT
jgi:SAM-dependent methyltransferase